MNPIVYWIAFKSILTKEVTRFTRIWVQTLVPPAITMSLYFIIFGNLIGSRLGLMHGVSYMEFIVPGLIMMCDHQLLRQRGLLVFQRQVSAQYRGDAGRSGPQLRDYPRFYRRRCGPWALCRGDCDGGVAIFCSIAGT